jgi:hypothetical protein
MAGPYYLNDGVTDLTSVSGLSGFADGEVFYIASGSQTVTANLAILDGSSKSANRIELAPAWTGTFNATFVFNCDNGTDPCVINRAGGGTFNFAPRTGGAITRFIQNGSGTSAHGSSSGTVTTVEVNAGTYTAGGSALATNLYQSGGTSTWAYSATALTLAHITGGTASVQRTITTLYQGGGTVTVYRDTVGSTMPTATTVYLLGGTLNWKGGNITTLYVEGTGVFDSSASPTAFTITNLHTTPAAREASDFTNATITNYYPKGEKRTAP